MDELEREIERERNELERERVGGREGGKSDRGDQKVFLA